MPCKRGTTNGNARGSSYARRIRKAWVLATFDPELGPRLVRCYRCKKFLGWLTLTIDRILPGCQGGTYARDNIRPCCGRCNSETGGRTRRSTRNLVLQ